MLLNNKIIQVYLLMSLNIIVTFSQQNDEIGIVGNWKEDQYQRENLDAFLKAFGINWFKRIFATSTYWENTQLIKYDAQNRVYDISGTKGPRGTKFEFLADLNNQTISRIDMGELGGPLDLTAEVRDNTLFTYLTSPKTNKMIMKASRRRIADQKGVPTFAFNIFHYPTKTNFRAIYLKQE